MKRRFTKYPSNYIGAASETSGAANRRRKREFEQKAREGAELLATDGEWELWTPHNYEASIYISRMGIGNDYTNRPRWDTAHEGYDYYFKSYNDRGPLYIFVNTANPAEKYQSHPASKLWFVDINDHVYDEQALIDFLDEHPAFAEFFDV